MSDEETPLGPEHEFKRVIWRSMLSFSSPLQQSATWTITGVAAIAALLIGKLDSVAQIVSASGLRWGLILFAFALLSGGISKQVGMAVTNSLETIKKLEELLRSPDGERIIFLLRSEPKRVIEDLAKPFWWPLSYFVRSSGLRGFTDCLSADKRLIRVLCIQICTASLHSLSAAAGIITIAFSIKG